MLRSKIVYTTGLISVFLYVAFLSNVAYAQSPLEEAKLDRQIGILNHPWKINLIRIVTLDYLRQQSLHKSGLPSYDKLVTGNALSNQTEVQNVTITSNGKKPSPSMVPAPESNTTVSSGAQTSPPQPSTTSSPQSSTTSSSSPAGSAPPSAPSSSPPVVSQPTTGPYQPKEPNLDPILPLDPTEFN
ncbi:hypothetical protein [Desulfopila sp. IMCC35008]|uniref:hypothetical protein n=1 Tax=Desulfopila sp. IMCC35008 TaxID=2653858 RepID=UPI0013D6C359|nr:hypothetical protein [Desulfopila sp. IMCC35008]